MEIGILMRSKGSMVTMVVKSSTIGMTVGANCLVSDGRPLTMHGSRSMSSGAAETSGK